MITLGELFAWLLVALTIAWIWRGHGIRERALYLVKQHCENEQVQLLDENVALKGWRIIRDGKGQKRLARMYGFEFTVTSLERLSGSVAMFGRHLAKIELQAYPLTKTPQEAVVATQNPSTAATNRTSSNNVIELQDWRAHRKPED